MSYEKDYIKCVQQMEILASALATAVGLHVEVSHVAAKHDPSKPEVQIALAGLVRKSQAATVTGQAAYNVIYESKAYSQVLARINFSEGAYVLRTQLEKVNTDTKNAMLQGIAAGLGVK